MGTDATDDSPTYLPAPSVGEVVVDPPLRGHARANDIPIQEGLQKGHFQKFAFSSTPKTVNERRGRTIAVVHDSGGE